MNSKKVEQLIDAKIAQFYKSANYAEWVKETVRDVLTELKADIAKEAQE